MDNLDIILLLLEHGANPLSPDFNGESPFMRAVQEAWCPLEGWCPKADVLLNHLTSNQ